MISTIISKIILTKNSSIRSPLLVVPYTKLGRGSMGNSMKGCRFSSALGRGKNCLLDRHIDQLSF